MKMIVSIIAAVLLVSCGNSPLTSRLQGSDSIAVRFKQPGTDSIIKIVASSHPYAIKDLLRFAGSEETEQYKCGYDGDIIFYKKGNPAGDISFNYSTDGCHHFLQMVNGKPVATKMNNEAKDFLKALAAGTK